MDGPAFDTIAKLFAEHRLSRRRALRTGASLAAGALAAAGATAAVAATEGAPGSGALVADPARLPGTAETALPAAGKTGFTVLEMEAPGATAVATPVAEGAKPTMFLFLQSFETGSLVPKAGSPGHYTLTLRQGLGETVYFSDRPQKIVGTLPTPKFLDALGFPPDNPPNAALVGHRSATHKDIVVLELFDPKYDTATNTATYEANLLQDWQELDETFEQTPDDAKHVPRDFTAAHLFIDDCPDRGVACVRDGKTVGDLGNKGTCWNWLKIICEDCGNYSADCNAAFPDVCQGNCHAFNCVGSFCH